MSEDINPVMSAAESGHLVLWRLVVRHGYRALPFWVCVWGLRFCCDAHGAVPQSLRHYNHSTICSMPSDAALDPMRRLSRMMERTMKAEFSFPPDKPLR